MPQQILDAAGVVDRCELVGGSFFEASRSSTGSPSSITS